MLRQDIVGLTVCVAQEPHQPEVAQLYEAVLVNEHVGGLQVSMDQLGAVQVLQGFGDLVHDKLLVRRLQDILSDGRVQVGLHEFEYEIDVQGVFGADHLHKLNYVFMP